MEMNSEIYHPINLIDCECSINSIDYNATDLVVELERFDNKGIVRVEFKEVFAYRVTLEHFRINDILIFKKGKKYFRALYPMVFMEDTSFCKRRSA